VNLGAGLDSMDLSGLVPANAPGLSEVYLKLDDGYADKVHGTDLADIVQADDHDEVHSYDGNDTVINPRSVDAGAGHDTIEAPLNDAVGGPGDDGIENPIYGPVHGGTGTDRIRLEFAPKGNSYTMTLRPSSFTYVSSAVDRTVVADGIEEYEVVLDANAPQVLDATTFLGPVTATGGVGADTFWVRNGHPDRIDCGAGADTVVADLEDVLVGCEAVDSIRPQSGVTGPRKVKRGRTAHLALASDVAGAGFVCQIDRRTPVACPAAYALDTRTLKVGRHTVTVTAVVNGIADDSPAVHLLRVTRPKHRRQRAHRAMLSAGAAGATAAPACHRSAGRRAR